MKAKNDLYEECVNHVFISDKSKVLEWSVELEEYDIKESEDDLYEECVNHSLISQHSRVLDWSVEVDDVDVITDDRDDSVKVI